MNSHQSVSRAIRAKRGGFLIAPCLISAILLACARPTLVTTTAPLPDHAQAPAARQTLTSEQRTEAAKSYARLPMSFEANRGQTDAQVNYLARGAGYTLFLTADEIVLKLADIRQPLAKKARAGDVLRIALASANPHADSAGIDPQPGKSNYLLGADRKTWHTGIEQFAKVRYDDVYPGVDLVFYGNQRDLEYDFVVAPGANPNVILMDVRGASGVAIDKQGDAVLHTANGGDLRLHRPVLYQMDGAKRRPVEGGYVRAGKQQLALHVGDYDHDKPLVIDPVLSYSTYLGGTSSMNPGFEQGHDIAIDAAGNVYVAGETPTADFPTTVGAYQPSYHGSNDAIVVKLNADGTALVYATYLGGSSQDRALAVAVDAAGNAYLAGATDSADFPVTIAAGLGGGYEAFVAKLNVSGSALLFSNTGGGSADDIANAIALDPTGAYVCLAGETASSDFGPLASPNQSSFGGGARDAFLAVLTTSGGGLITSTYYGGSGDDVATGVACMPSGIVGEVYLAGTTTSSNLLVANGQGQVQAALQPFHPGSTDGFLAKFTGFGGSNTPATYATFLGGSGNDRINALAVDAAGNAYVIGTTSSPNFPVVGGVGLGPFGNDDAFVTKINAAGSALIYSTYLGNPDGNDSGNDIALDASGRAYIVGTTAGTFNASGWGALQPTSGGLDDAFLSILSVSGSVMEYATYLGGAAPETGNGVALDAAGNVYVVGQTSSSNFPVSNALQPFIKGTRDIFISKNYLPAALYDADSDGLTNTQEAALGTNPNSADTDGDGLSDYNEVNRDGNPSNYTPGTDTNPNNSDTDGDGFLDGGEVQFGSNPLSAASKPGSPLRVSTDSIGAQVNGNSDYTAISSDGRYVAFISNATNLVAGDTNGAIQDVYVKDIQTGISTRVSTNSIGVQSNTSHSFGPAISADGRYVAFYSEASTLVTGDTNGYSDVFVKDTQTGATTRVSTDSAGAQGNLPSVDPTISADGRYVAFWTRSSLVAGDTNSTEDVYVKDTQTGSTTRVSTNSAGAQGNSSSANPSISADGRYVAFDSSDSNLVSGDTNVNGDVFVKDTQTGVTTRVSTDSAGAESNGQSQEPAISADGRYVAFISYATNLVAGVTTSGIFDVYVKDTQTGAVTRVSTDSTGAESDATINYYPTISADGRYVAFISDATNLAAGDSNGLLVGFVKDTQLGITTRVTVNPNGYDGDGGTISADGRYVVFPSGASNLVGGDTNGTFDIFRAKNPLFGTAANVAPVATNDSITTSEDIAVTSINVLANDTDADGTLDTTSVVVVTVPAHGAATVNGDGTITYTPALNYNGADSFTYTVKDNSGATSNVATVNVTVTAVNDPPVAANDSITTPEDIAAASIIVLGNDSDVDGTLVATSVVVVTVPAHGAATVNGDGTITYTPALNYNGADSFTYTVKDNSGATSNVATVSVTVTAVNDPPVAANDSITTSEDIAVASIILLGNDSDVDGTLVATSVVVVTAPTHGAATVNGDGTITYTPALNYNGADSFTYTVKDNSGATSNVATVSVTVTAVNDPPVANDDSYATDEDIILVQPASGVLGNDTDADGNALSAMLVGGPAHGSLDLNLDGSFTYVPAANFNGADSFTYKANDGSSDGNVATVNITVNPVIDIPPTVTSISVGSLLQYASADVTVTGTNFVDGAHVDFGTGVRVNSVTYVDSTTLLANVSVLSTATPGAYAVSVTNPDAGSGSSGTALMTLIADSDGDGVPNASDNCPSAPNPDQSDLDHDGVGDVCDNSPENANPAQTDSNGDGVGDASQGQVTMAASTSSPASVSGYYPHEPVYVTANVTFNPSDFNGDLQPDNYYVLAPNPYNVILIVTDNTTGQVINPDVILEGPPISIPGDLIAVSGSAKTFSTVIDLTQWYTNLPPGNFTVNATYVSFLKDPELGAGGVCQSGATCFTPIWMGTAPAGSNAVHIQGSTVSVPPPIVSARTVVVPSAWDRTWETEPSAVLIDLYVGNLSSGHNAAEIAPAKVLLNGTVSPVSSELLVAYGDFSGSVLHLRFNRTQALQSLHALLGMSARLHDGEQEAAQLSGVLTDLSGNDIGLFRSISDSITLQDLTAPMTVAASAPAANVSGWNTSTPVTVSFTATDSISGVMKTEYRYSTNGGGTWSAWTAASPTAGSVAGASPYTNGVAFSGDGAYTVQYRSLDTAANQETAHSLAVRIDKTKPVLAMPSLAAAYAFGTTLTLNFGATDATSGVASVQATLNGTPIARGASRTLTHQGANTFTLTATDNAGNTQSQSVTFTVGYIFGGFLAPLNNNTTRVFKLGSVIPIKFQLTTASGAYVSTAKALLTLQQYSGITPLGDAIYTTASCSIGNTFRYDATSKQYIFNMSTKGLSKGTWQIQVHLDDGSVRSVMFGLKQ